MILFSITTHFNPKNNSAIKPHKHFQSNRRINSTSTKNQKTIYMQQIGRQLGYILRFPSTTVSNLLANKSFILSSLQQHGCICIKDVDFEEQHMVDFTAGIWNEVIELPRIFCLNNLKEEFKKVARVGNVLVDGTLKDSQKQANYWHQDGDFWGDEKKHISNCLHARILPESGGDTHVIDLVEGAVFLKKNKPNIYAKLQRMIGTLNMQEIIAFKSLQAKNTLNTQTITKHKLLKKWGNPPKQCLFLSAHRIVDPSTGQQCPDLSFSQIHDILEKEIGYYTHRWEKGDLLIWDNVQVIHRAEGQFQGKRLLFRTQGRFQN